MKRCSKCHVERDESMYHKDNRNKLTGLKYECKICDRERRVLNAVAIQDRKRTYYLTNKEYICEARRVYVKDNATLVSEDKRRFYDSNRDKILELKRQNYFENKDVILKRNSDYAKTTNGKTSKINSRGKRRKLKRDTMDGSLPQTILFPLTKELSDLLIEQKYRCVECNCLIAHKLGNIHLDHIHPLSKGGSHSITNVQWLCATCNLMKGSAT